MSSNSILSSQGPKSLEAEPQPSVTLHRGADGRGQTLVLEQRVPRTNLLVNLSGA